MIPTQPTHTTPEVSEALVERAFDIGRMWNHALTGHVCDARDVARTLQSDLFKGLPIAPWPINMHSSRDEAIVDAVKAIKAALVAALSPRDGVPGMVLVPKTALDWLFGEGPDEEGHWFGDGNFPTKGSYWWRAPFRAMLFTASWEETP